MSHFFASGGQSIGISVPVCAMKKHLPVSPSNCKELAQHEPRLGGWELEGWGLPHALG